MKFIAAFYEEKKVHHSKVWTLPSFNAQCLVNFDILPTVSQRRHAFLSCGNVAVTFISIRRFRFSYNMGESKREMDSLNFI